MSWNGAKGNYNFPIKNFGDLILDWSLSTFPNFSTIYHETFLRMFPTCPARRLQHVQYIYRLPHAVPCVSPSASMKTEQIFPARSKNGMRNQSKFSYNVFPIKQIESILTLIGSQHFSDSLKKMLLKKIRITLKRSPCKHCKCKEVPGFSKWTLRCSKEAHSPTVSFSKVHNVSTKLVTYQKFILAVLNHVDLWWFCTLQNCDQCFAGAPVTVS